jgi:hypothetical protein
VNAIDGRSLMKCAVITINYLYDGKIINHAEIVPRSSKSRTPAADKNRGFLVLYLLPNDSGMPVLANRNRGYKPQPAAPEVMIHYLDTIASPEMEREGLLPAFTTLIDMSQNTHCRSTTGKAILWIGEIALI